MLASQAAPGDVPVAPSSSAAGTQSSVLASTYNVMLEAGGVIILDFVPRKLLVTE
ncbi:MAG TPA: hypothetical protein VEY13_04845 [Rubrobacteraceae bacterium]|nr:hypothetical protein [Rubrobacteraceae bacterium]